MRAFTLLLLSFILFSCSKYKGPNLKNKDQRLLGTYLYQDFNWNGSDYTLYGFYENNVFKESFKVYSRKPNCTEMDSLVLITGTYFFSNDTIFITRPGSTLNYVFMVLELEKDYLEVTSVNIQSHKNSVPLRFERCK